MYTYIYMYIFFSVSGESSSVLISCVSVAAVLECDLFTCPLFVQFLGGRDTVKLCVEQGEPMGKPCA